MVRLVVQQPEGVVDLVAATAKLDKPEHQMVALMAAAVQVGMRMVLLALCALFGRVQVVHSHQQTQVICNGTVHSNPKRSTV